jgi:acyl-CoA thioesterase
MTDTDKIKETIAGLKTGARTEPIARFLGMKLVKITPGYARVTMKVLPEHINFNGLVFGGIIAAIADQAFAYGSNSLFLPSYATQFNIHFVNGADVGDELIAECRVVRSGRRVGISEMTVTNQTGRLIARATGTTIPVSQSKGG